jgi:hypothetical protein
LTAQRIEVVAGKGEVAAKEGEVTA